MEDNELENVEHLLERMEIPPHTVLPDDIATPEDISKFPFHPADKKGISVKDVNIYRKTVYNTVKSLLSIIENRDADILRVGDEAVMWKIKFTNEQLLNNEMKARGVEIVEDSIAGVPTDVAIENSQLKETNRVFSEKITILDQQIAALRENDRKMREWGATASAEYARMEETLKDRDAEIKRMESPGSLEHSLAKAKEKFDAEIAAAREEKNTWMEQNTIKDNTIADLQRDNDNLRAQMEALSTSIEEKDEESEANASERITQLEADVLQLQQEIDQKDEVIAQHQKYAKEMEEWGSSIQEENEELRRQAEAAGNDLPSQQEIPDDPFSIEEGTSLEELRKRFGGDLLA